MTNITFSQKMEFKTKPLDIKVITEVSSYLKTNYKKEDVFGDKLDLKGDFKYQNLMKPVIENGKMLHNEILSIVKGSKEWNDLSKEEQESFINYTDENFVGLSLAYSTSSYARFAPRVESCLAVAVGAVAIYDLIMNTAALGTVQTLIGAIRLIGRSYLGWLGVAAMIWEFSDCMNG